MLFELRNSDGNSIGFLFDKYAHSLYAIARAITGDDKISEEVLQKSFVIILENLGDFPASNQTLFTWMCCIARETARQTLNLEKNKLTSEIQSGTKTVANKLMAEYESQNGMEATKDQRILELIGLRGYTVQMAAEMLKLTEEEIKIILRDELIKYRKNKIQ